MSHQRGMNERPVLGSGRVTLNVRVWVLTVAKLSVDSRPIADITKSGQSRLLANLTWTKNGGAVMRLVGLATVLAWATAASVSAQVPPKAPSLVTAPQKPYAECVKDPEAYLALPFRDFDQGVRPIAGGPRQEWGWREIANQKGCDIAAAMLISQWRERHGASLDPRVQSFLTFHEGQMRATGGDYSGAIPLIEAGRVFFNDAAGHAYVDAMLAFLRSDRTALTAARERLLAVPEPPNWPEIQRAYKEQAGQEMRWPQNIEATDKLVRCFGKPYGECS